MNLHALPLLAPPPAAPDATPTWLVAAGAVGSLALLALGVVIVVRATGRILTVTPATLFVLYYIVFIFIGSLLLVLDRGDGAYYHIPGSRNYLLLFTVGAAPLAFAAGVWLANRWTRLRPAAELDAHWRSGWSDAKPDRGFVTRFAVLAAVCVVVSIAVLTLGPAPPLVYLLLHPFNHTYAFDLALDHVRLTYLSPHAGALPFQATLYQFYGNLMPLLSIVALALAERLRSRRWLLAGLALLGGSFLMAAVTLTKNPVENLLVLLFVAWLWFGRRRLGPGRVAAMTGIALGAFFAVVLITNRSVSLLQIVSGALRRLFLVQAQVLYSIYDLIPDRMGYLHGGAFWMDLRNLKPGPKSTLDFGTWLYSVIVSNQPSFSGIGSAPTVFFGQVYADFGVIGALLAMVAVGCLAQLAYVWYLRRSRAVVTWAVFVGLTASIPRLTTSSFVAIGIQYGIAASILFGLYFSDWRGLIARLTRRRATRSPASFAEAKREAG